MEYGNFLVEIYERANNHEAATASPTRYFYSPLALLDHSSAVSSYNVVTKQQEMRFRVEMWNDKVQKQVVKYLNEIVGHEIKSDQVRVLPLEKVLLTSYTPPVDFWLNPWWTYYDKSKILNLSLTCYDRKVCDKLANLMRTNPEHLNHLKLLYSLSSQTSQTKQAYITIDSITSGRLVLTLLKKFQKTNQIYLTANDEKKMLKETATNILMDTFDDSEVWSRNSEVQIFNILKGLLVTSRTTIEEESDKIWDSVFWDDDNYRPDKTAKTLNEIVNKLDKDSQKILTDMFQKAEKQSVNSNSWDDVNRISSIISGKMANDFDFDDVKKLLEESIDHVQWNGEKFVPKPIQLSKIKLATFRDSQSFQDRNVSVHYTTADLSAPIKFEEFAGLTITDELTGLKKKE
jgi:hypothetical protein